MFAPHSALCRLSSLLAIHKLVSAHVDCQVGQRLLVPTHVFGDAAAACDRQRKVALSRALQPGVSRTRGGQLVGSGRQSGPWLRARFWSHVVTMSQSHTTTSIPQASIHIVFTIGAFQPRL